MPEPLNPVGALPHMLPNERQTMLCDIAVSLMPIVSTIVIHTLGDLGLPAYA